MSTMEYSRSRDMFSDNHNHENETHRTQEAAHQSAHHTSFCARFAASGVQQRSTAAAPANPADFEKQQFQRQRLTPNLTPNSQLAEVTCDSMKRILYKKAGCVQLSSLPTRR